MTPRARSVDPGQRVPLLVQRVRSRRVHPNAIWSAATGRGVPIVFGVPAYGGGTFERMGIPTFVPLLVAFLVVCLLEAVAGTLLWSGQRSGAILSFALLLRGAVFWVGLPYPPITALVRTVLIVLSWSSLE